MKHSEAEKAREAIGLTLEQAAKRPGISKGYLRRMEIRGGCGCYRMLGE